jgi:hypothetical protein
MQLPWTYLLVKEMKSAAGYQWPDINNQRGKALFMAIGYYNRLLKQVTVAGL